MALIVFLITFSNNVKCLLAYRFFFLGGKCVSSQTILFCFSWLQVVVVVVFSLVPRVLNQLEFVLLGSLYFV